MKLSEKKQSATYTAIADPIMDLRLQIIREDLPDGAMLDSRLFQLQNRIWKEVHKALNLEGPA